MSLIFVKTGGRPEEIGHDIGVATGALVRELVARNPKFYTRQTGRSYGFIAKYALRQFLPLVRRFFPDYVAEVKGIAAGAGVEFSDAFVFSCEEELLDIWQANSKQRLGLSTVEKCTSIAVRTREALLLGHNEDYLSRYADKMVVMRVEPNGLPAFLSLAYPGTLGGSACGLNDVAMAFGGNSLRFPLRRRGIPKNFILRHLLVAKSLAHVERIMRFGPRATAGSVLIADAEDDAAAYVETTLKETAVTKMGRSGLLAHTNHVLSPELDNRLERPTISSRHRLVAVLSSLHGRGGRARRGELKEALDAARQIKRDSITLATAIMRPQRGEMLVRNWSERRHNWRRFKL